VCPCSSEVILEESIHRSAFAFLISTLLYLLRNSFADDRDMASNIDRQFAIWQTLNPGPEHWFDHLPDDEVKSTDKLAPFRYIDDKGKVQDYTSELVRNWKRLGYQYEILEAPGKNNSVLLAELSRLYNRTAPVMMRVSRLEGDQKIEGTDNDYVANVVYDR
jgi:hypothetical protein